MQPRFVRIPLFVSALAALLLAGCGKNNPMSANGGSSGSAADKAAVSNTVAATTNLVDDGLMESADQALFSPTDNVGADNVGPTAAIRPLRYWRRITSIKRTYEFAFSDTDTTGRPTKAVVTVNKVLTGTFNVLFDATPGDTMAFDTLGVVHKPLHDLWVRRVLLQRVKQSHHDHGDEMGSDPDTSDGGHPDDDHDQWKVSGISGVDVRSFTPPDTTSSTRTFGKTKIESVRIQSGVIDTTITDPLQFVRLRKVHCFGPSEDVTLTVTTASDTDVVVLIRTGFRHRFHNNGDGTYTLTWHTNFEDGIRHFGVNAISKGTLFDDQAPYDSDAWIFPYMINPWEMATYMP